ncbi:MAG: pyridoxamine 5'-phosphate oxidase family protein [Clostridiales bacterium]|nr:pyridoxamine 5'-phosphate oxidase family protein [Clostridiales bacterium]
MRRKDREVTDSSKIREIIEKSEVIRIGYYDNGEVYIVPVNFGYVETDGEYTFYFHGANAGRKYELSKNGCEVGFELESRANIVIDDVVSCRSTCYFNSVIGNGKISLITDLQEKDRALNIIMKHFTGKDIHTFDEKWLNVVAIFKLDVEKLTCKARI